MTVSCHDIHSQAVALITKVIKEVLEISGIEAVITPAENRYKPYDFLINGLKVTVRGAVVSAGPHQVTVRGKSYCYRYRSFHFNLHIHKEPIKTDFVICACLAVKGAGKLELGDFFAFPRAAYPGKVFSLHAGQGSYHGRLAPYRNTWQGLLLTLASQNRAALHEASAS